MARTVTLKGTSLELTGHQLHIGDTAPSATLRKDLLTDYTLSDANGKPRIYSVVPSLDTPVCADQTRRFNKEAATLNEILWFTISCDLPVAMARFCGSEGIDTGKIQVLSDHKNLDFGQKFGTLIPELRILCRAVFVIDKNNTIVYADYVSEISEHPNYDAVLEAAKTL